ncbi:MAG: hypothetical protein MUE53_02205 [Chitinophagales bacterium]|jgi:gliding motility-associated protein GldC|nr:hypothetical protein [Chitinophagales bacterium]
MSLHYSDISLKIGLNENKIPQDLKWRASDSGNENYQDCKIFNLGIWSTSEKNVLNINLWREDTQLDEMHAFYFRYLMQITESYCRATQNPYAMEEMKNFVEALAKKTAAFEDSRNS